MKNIYKIIIACSFIAIIAGLGIDTKVSNDIAKASYYPGASIFDTSGSSSQYLRGDDTWQTLNPAAMGVPSGTTAQYFDGTLALQTFPTIPAAQVQSDFTQTNSGAIDFIKNKPIASYKSYQGILTQTGTSAPTVTTGNNDFGATTFTWTRLGAGSYRVTASTPVFTANKTVVIFSDPSNTLINYTATVTSTTTITVTTSVLSVLTLILTPTSTDGILSNILVEIRVYN